MSTYDILKFFHEFISPIYKNLKQITSKSIKITLGFLVDRLWNWELDGYLYNDPQRTYHNACRQLYISSMTDFWNLLSS